VILDTKLRFPLDSKLLKNHQEGKGRCPWIFCSPPQSDVDNFAEWQKRKNLLQHAGAVVFEVPTASGVQWLLILIDLTSLLGQLSILEVLQKLRESGIRSVMVEGGANVIASFLSAASASKPAVDIVIVTVAPIFVGGDGGAYQLNKVGIWLPHGTNRLIFFVTDPFPSSCEDRNHWQRHRGSTESS